MALITTDRERIEKIIELLPEEYFDYFLNMSLYNARHKDKQLDTVQKYINFSRQTFSQFSDKKLKDAKKIFDISLNKLVNFMVYNFFRHTQDLFILYPDQKNSPKSDDRIFWERKLNELRKIIDEVELNYKNLFMVMKKNMENNNETKGSQFQINRSQVHFGNGNNIVDNKIIKESKRWWEKTWIQAIALVSSLLGIISFVLYLFNK